MKFKLGDYVTNIKEHKIGINSTTQYLLTHKTSSERIIQKTKQI